MPEDRARRIAPSQPPRLREVPAPRTRQVFVRDLVVPCLIGVHRHERDGAQRVRVNLELDVIDGPVEDRLSDVVNYETLIDAIRRLTAAGHVNLVETLAERIAALCFDDARVLAARVRVEKLDVVSDAASVGVEIERSRPET